MRALRFDKSGIKMEDAAVALAVSQEEWATYVGCSYYDWTVRAPEMMMCIMKDGFPSFRMEDYIEGAKDFHDILIRPCHQIPQGWVCLERKL